MRASASNSTSRSAASRRSRSASAAWPRPLICSTRRAGSPAPASISGHKPAVVTAIMKAQATERLRVVVNDAMDVHGGKGVQEGPLNYLGTLYRAVPIGITVEGANIVTRALIQFGQGAIRSHPYLLQGNDRAGGSRPRARPRGVRPRVLGPCRAQLRQCVPRLGARLDRRHLCAGAAMRAPRAASTSRSGATPRPSRSPSTWRC